MVGVSAPADALAAPDALAPLMAATLAALAEGERTRGGPLPTGGPCEVAARVNTALMGEVLPEHGVGTDLSLGALVEALAWGSTDPRDPRCSAHLHCPPLAVAVAADMAVSALNPSLDSWDQAPAGVAVEAHVIQALAELAGLPAGAGGAVTSGATESNLHGLLLAREHLGPGLAVACSAAAHFSVRQAAGVIGLPAAAVEVVPVDEHDRMDIAALDRLLEALGGRPVAIVGTAGTTDLGAVDPLEQLAARAAHRGAWLHVDAAYGGAALFSDRLRPLLAGLGSADSVALDLHKLGWQPVPAGVFVVRDARLLKPTHRRAAYLNPVDDEDAGFGGRLAPSLRTTRRPDAFPIAVTMRALGRTGLGALVDRCHGLARHAAERVAQDPRLTLAAPPVLTSVVFRYAAAGDGHRSDHVNAGLRRRLLEEGAAVVGRTERHGRTHLKLTLLNPHATTAAVDALLEAVAAAGTANDDLAEVARTVA